MCVLPRFHRARSVCWGVLTLAAVVGPARAAAGEPARPIDYNRQIRPILSRNCFPCHGQDEAHRARGLRLDVREIATQPLADGTVAIVPGNAEESEVVFRITEEDENVHMPPKKTGNRLEPEEIELITRWIEQGAPYADHWAYLPLRREPLPEVADRSWPRNGIDRFILQRLEAEGLKPAPEADRFVLLRRASLDLRGLPPSPEEFTAYARDLSADAYERAVERFLDDPAFGERWARMWLDLARYADSAGYGSDPLRPNIWRYRDWVIDAFNGNLPFDQFTIEQLAGDLLAAPTLEQRIATAFHRNTMTNTEGGTDDEEFRVAAIKDRADSTAQIWMGLTLGCAKCHSHKYDPITQEEYYRFYAFFNQTADSDKPDEQPTLAAPTPDMAAKHQRIDAEIAALRAELDQETPELAAAQAAWEAGLKLGSGWRVLEPLAVGSEQGTELAVQPDQSILAGGPNPDREVYRVTARTDLKDIGAYRLEVFPDPSLPEQSSGRGRSGRFIVTRITITAQPAGPAAVGPQAVDLERAEADFTENRFAAADLLKPEGEQRAGWSIGTGKAEPRTLVLVARQPLGLAPAELTFRIEQQSDQAGANLGRFRLSVTSDPAAVRRLGVPGAILAILDAPDDQRTAEQRARLRQHFRSIAPELKAIRDRIASLEKSRPEVPRVPVLVELPAEQRRQTRLLRKGNFLDPGPPVEPGTPAALHAFPPDAPANRLGLARWLIDPNNPLTARVSVNRYWAQLFGTGLVETEEDFGTQGDIPSHPELLDWLAQQFVRSGWDTKALLRLIVTSATYRQSAKVRPELAAIDPRNRLLARAPRFRLEAEIVRDQALALSGLLSRKVGGPSVYPPQPEGLWQAAFNGQRTWPTSTGADRYRRGLYTFWRRTVPYPSMATFDAPSRETCTIRRSRTNNPLQAFVTLNDPVFVECAQALARRIIREGGSTPEERIRYGLQLCLCRPPAAPQVAPLLALYHQQRNRFAGDSEAAKALATEPLGPLPEGFDAVEAAAWTVVANVLLNLDGVLTKG